MTRTAIAVCPCVRSTPSPPRPKMVTCCPVRPSGRRGSGLSVVAMQVSTAEPIFDALRPHERLRQCRQRHDEGKRRLKVLYKFVIGGDDLTALTFRQRDVQ